MQENKDIFVKIRPKIDEGSDFKIWILIKSPFLQTSISLYKLEKNRIIPPGNMGKRFLVLVNSSIAGKRESNIVVDEFWISSCMCV